MSKCNCGCGSSSAPKTSEVRHKGKIVQIADDGLLVDLSVQQSECECCALSAACSRNNRNIVKIFGANKLKLEVGDKVEVLEGIFKGCKGEIMRVKGDRRLVVSIAGLVVVATAFIHPSLVRKIDN